jgi:hypothetical protein
MQQGGLKLRVSGISMPFFAPDIIRTAGLRNRTIAIAAAMAKAASVASRVGIVIDP